MHIKWKQAFVLIEYHLNMMRLRISFSHRLMKLQIFLIRIIFQIQKIYWEDKRGELKPRKHKWRGRSDKALYTRKGRGEVTHNLYTCFQWGRELENGRLVQVLNGWLLIEKTCYQSNLWVLRYYRRSFPIL